QGQAALVGRMAQHDPTVLGIAGAVLQHPSCKDTRQSRIILVAAGARRIGHHLRSDHDRGRRVEEGYTIGDGGYVPMHERDQTPRGDQHLFPCWRLPQDLPVECPGLHIQPPVVAYAVRIGQPEGLVVHKELDDLAVRHVHDGLARFREAVGFLAVDDRPVFIEPIDEGAVFGGGPAFLRAPTHAEVAVAHRQHRFQLGQKCGVKAFFDDVPLVGRVSVEWRPEAFMMDHRAVPRERAWGVGPSTSSPRSCTTRCAPWCRSSSTFPLRATPITSPKFPLRPAWTPEMASSTTTARGGATPSCCAARRKVSGAGLPARWCAWIVLPSTRTSKQASNLVAFKTTSQF